jgi:activator of HSP90 ATPase
MKINYIGMNRNFMDYFKEFLFNTCGENITCIDKKKNNNNRYLLTESFIVEFF